MNKSEACKILNLPMTFTKDELKKRFRMLALKYHPDKSNTTTHDHFIKIHQAYKLLSNDKVTYSYNELLKEFISSINKSDSVMILMIEKLSVLQKDYCVSIFQKLDFKTAYNIYICLYKYREIIKISDDLLIQFEKILQSKAPTNNTFIIKPSLNDLLISNIFRLEYDNKEFYIPMWHEEVLFDNNKDPIIVRCIPSLDENITIDENNNLHIKKQLPINDIINQKEIIIDINNIKLTILRENLYIRPYQIIKFLQRGIPKINESDIYNDELKSDIYIHLTIIF